MGVELNKTILIISISVMLLVITPLAIDSVDAVSSFSIKGGKFVLPPPSVNDVVRIECELSDLLPDGDCLFIPDENIITFELRETNKEFVEFEIKTTYRKEPNKEFLNLYVIRDVHSQFEIISFDGPSIKRGAGVVDSPGVFSFDHDVGHFVNIGTGTVSDDGTMIVSDPGFGIVKSG